MYSILRIIEPIFLGIAETKLSLSLLFIQHQHPADKSGRLSIIFLGHFFFHFINTFLILLLLLFCARVARQRRQRDYCAGVMLTMAPHHATNIKWTPQSLIHQFTAPFDKHETSVSARWLHRSYRNVRQQIVLIGFVSRFQKCAIFHKLSLS